MLFAKVRYILNALPLYNRTITQEVFKATQTTAITITNRAAFFRRTYCNQPRHIVQMRGLANETTEKDVLDFFKSLGIVPVDIRLKFDGSGRVAMTGVSEVEFASHAEAVVAMRKKNSFLGNRFVRLTLKSSELYDKEEKQADGKLNESVKEPKADLNIAANSNSLYHPVGPVVRMKNAPRRATETTIHEFFSSVHCISTSVKPVYDEFGLRTGEFDVEFLTKSDALRSMARNNAYLGSKCIELSFK